MDIVMERIIPGTLIGLAAICCAFLLWLPFAIYQDAQAETFSLRKDQWVCSQSHSQVTTTTVLVGKVVMPQTSVQTVCSQWSRK